MLVTGEVLHESRLIDEGALGIQMPKEHGQGVVEYEVLELEDAREVDILIGIDRRGWLISAIAIVVVAICDTALLVYTSWAVKRPVA